MLEIICNFDPTAVCTFKGDGIHFNISYDKIMDFTPISKNL